jgi:hypothetical protein
MKHRALALLVVAAALAAIFAYLWLSPEQVLKRAVEKEGSAICGAPVRVERVTWSKDTRTFVVGGLAIANPPGFPPGDVLVVPVIEIGVDPATIDKGPVHVDRLTLSAPRVQLATGATGSNFDAVERHIREATPRPDAPRFVVDLLAIRDATAQLASGSQVDLPGVRNTDVGETAGGLTATELARTLSDEMSQRLRLVMGIESIKSGIRSLLGD